MFLTPGSRAARFRLPLIHETGLLPTGNLAMRNGPVTQGMHFYETYINDSNYRRAVIDHNTVIGFPGSICYFGPESLGTPAQAKLIVSSGAATYWQVIGASWGTSNGTITFGGAAGSFDVASTGAYGWQDVNIHREAAGVAGIGTSTAGVPAITPTGWLQWGGQARVASDFSVTSSTTLVNVTGLTVNLQAGRTYTFDAELSYTCAAAGGVKAAILGTATATSIAYDGFAIDSGANGVVGNAQSTSLGGVVASSVTTGTAGHITIKGSITVNVAGTLAVQFAQNTSNGTASVVKRGSCLIVNDMRI